jgi:hypothetical protein
MVLQSAALRITLAFEHRDLWSYFFFHLKGSTKAFGLQVTRDYRKPNDFALPKHTVVAASRIASREDSN